MQYIHSLTPSRVFKLLAGLFIGKVLVGVGLNYRDYLPPNFQADFLLGREDYFWHGYHWPFYIHIFSAPISLVFGMILISDAFRRRLPKWHRRFGRMQAVIVLFLVAPSGLGMARYPANGPVAGVGFSMLAAATGLTVALGWRAAVQRKFAGHRRWMLRCFLLLCSAVVVRVNGGLGEVLGIDANWFYAQVAWTSWLVPLLIFEGIQRVRMKPDSPARDNGSSPLAGAAGSLKSPSRLI